MENLNLQNGVDIIEIDRIKAAISRHGKKFLERIYTKRELLDCKLDISSLAARFAAKEAVAKALGTGIGDVSWLDIEITRDEKGAPKLKLKGSANKLAKKQGLDEWKISLSHTHSIAIASVVAWGNLKSLD